MKDTGDPALQRTHKKNEEDSRISSFGSVSNNGYISMVDQDYETLADYEEELMRKGNFEVLFPT